VASLSITATFCLRLNRLSSAAALPRQRIACMAHLDSQVAAAEVELSTDVLDRIDQINPPGVTINPADNGWINPAMEPEGRRR
jgi:hypothetical protein